MKKYFIISCLTLIFLLGGCGKVKDSETDQQQSKKEIETEIDKNKESSPVQTDEIEEKEPETNMKNTNIPTTAKEIQAQKKEQQEIEKQLKQQVTEEDQIIVKKLQELESHQIIESPLQEYVVGFGIDDIPEEHRKGSYYIKVKGQLYFFKQSQLNEKSYITSIPMKNVTKEDVLENSIFVLPAQ